MNTQIFNFLKKYSTNVNDVNRLLISSYLAINKISEPVNKLIKTLKIEDGDQDYLACKTFIDLIKAYDPEFGYEHLLELFEFVISPADKLVNGAVYTPQHIRRYITEQSFSKLKEDTFRHIAVGDISCGCGGFLVDAAKKIKEATSKRYSNIFKENIFGLDIQQYSTERTKILLTLLALSEGEDCEEFEFNIFQGNALAFNWLEDNIKIRKNGGFDILLGNPPYVCSRNMDEESKALLPNWSVSSTGHPDLYIPFFQICYEYLKDNGVLGYITVNTFFKSINGRGIRQYFAENKVKMHIIDFGGEQVFKSRSTYTCICFLEKQESEYLEYIQSDSKTIQSIQAYDFQKIPYMSLDAIHGWNLTNRDLVYKIENIGTKFGDLYKTRNGIATLKNDVYIFDPVQEDEKYFYLKSGTKIEKAVCKEIINPNRLIQKRSLDDLKRKIIFPYQYNLDGNVEIIDESSFKVIYPMAYEYLCSQRETLATRDKGNGNYPTWYAYGRNQSLDKMKYKLFFPHITPHLPHYAICSDEDLLFYNGIAVIADDKNELDLLKKIMESDVFWFYVESTSKNYSSGYYSLSRNYIKNFGIFPFSEEEKQYLLNEVDSRVTNRFICKKYGFN
ncbi:MAG: class I SAM-dependent DNA methyltransferase [Sulfuricurvum sp.]